MKILFLGDIVGRPGRTIVQKLLPEIKKEHGFDAVIANGENMTHGKGMNISQTEKMLEQGIDFFTSGNHIWKYKEIYQKLEESNFPLIRPANYPNEAPGKGYKIFQDSMMRKIAVINLIGRVFFKENFDCPFKTVDRILMELKIENPFAIIVDFHAEATSEKIAMAYHLNGRVSALLGTHTHVQTADETILPDKTAFITDVGMCGLSDSILGVDKNNVMKNFINQVPVAHEIMEGDMLLNGVVIELDNSGKAVNIERVKKELKY